MKTTRHCDLIDDFIHLNETGLILEICQKYYADNILMLSNGEPFAESKTEAYSKQKIFLETITSFEVRLTSQTHNADSIELIFSYAFTDTNSQAICFTGKHTQRWDDGKIFREDFETI